MGDPKKNIFYSALDVIKNPKNINMKLKELKKQI